MFCSANFSEVGPCLHTVSFKKARKNASLVTPVDSLVTGVLKSLFHSAAYRASGFPTYFNSDPVL